MVRGGTPVDKAVPGRIPRVAKLMALAIRFEGLIRDGVVKDQAELARLGHVTRARLSQIMGLLSLAPDIQEAILWLPAVQSGRQAVTERDLRPIAGELDWGRQRGRCGERSTETEVSADSSNGVITYARKPNRGYVIRLHYATEP
jgi:hypothetical protein